LGKLYFIASGTDGARTRLNAIGAPAPLTAVEAALEAQILSGAQTRSGAQKLGSPRPELELITEEDAYDFAHHRDTAALPAYRLVLNDAHQTRYYLDPVSGAIV